MNITLSLLYFPAYLQPKYFMFISDGPQTSDNLFIVYHNHVIKFIGNINNYVSKTKFLIHKTKTVIYSL